MKYVVKRFTLLIALIALVIDGTMSAKLTKTSSDNCKNSESENCVNNKEKNLKKRQAVITLENVALCNATRQECIFNCRGVTNCLDECPICPEVHTVSGMRRVVVEGVNDSFIHDSPIRGTNVTTVIKLVNLVNNTNLIDIPTNVNLTNLNHVHVYQNDSSDDGGEFGLGYSRFGSCCIVVEPKTCTSSSKGFNCHHKRHRTCGQQCTSRVIHAETRHRCSHGQNCAHKISYVPQPKRPRCIYTPNWPFVSCGGHYQQNCQGCYQHYGYGAQIFYGGHIPPRCHACYDDAFHMGPLYRRGPVFRPFYYHQPPCQLTGSCQTSYCSMYGCYGNEYVDPVWGNKPSYPWFQDRYQYHPSLPINEDDSSEFVDIKDELPNISTDGWNWGIEADKCKVVDNNGTAIIKNCSDNNKNAFAASPSKYPEYSIESFDDPESYDYEGDYGVDFDKIMGQLPPSAHEGFERTIWDDEVAGRPRNLRRRQAKLYRKHQIIYDE